MHIIDNWTWLTIKGYIADVSRSEFEYEIPLEHGQTMMAAMCPFRMEKRRYKVEFEGFLHHRRIFRRQRAVGGSEIELPSEDAAFAKPD